MKLVLPALALVVGTAFAVPRPGDELSADEKAVHAAIEDYVLGFYEAAPERLERALSKDMKKLGYWRTDTDQPWSDASHMDFESAIALAKSWNAGAERGELRPHEIVLHEVADKTATGKLTAEWGQDYFQLAKEADGVWRIHHVMWQSAPAQ